MASYRTGGVTFNTTSGNKTVVLTPENGDLAVVIAAHSARAGLPGMSDNNTNGASGNYSTILTAAKNSSADLISVFVRNQLFGNTTSTTFTTTPGSTTGGGLAVLMISGMSRMGANAVRASAASANQAAGTPNVNFPQVALTGNLCIGAVFNATSPATMTEPNGFTERHDVGYTTTTHGLEVVTRDSGHTAINIQWGSASASAYAALAIELDTTIPEMPVLTLTGPRGAV